MNIAVPGGAADLEYEMRHAAVRLDGHAARNVFHRRDWDLHSGKVLIRYINRHAAWDSQAAQIDLKVVRTWRNQFELKGAARIRLRMRRVAGRAAVQVNRDTGRLIRGARHTPGNCNPA